jgi:hypothetical protein
LPKHRSEWVNERIICWHQWTILPNKSADTSRLERSRFAADAARALSER